MQRRMATQHGGRAGGAFAGLIIVVAMVGVLAAIAVGLVFDVSPEQALAAVERLPRVPGRLNPLPGRGGALIRAGLENAKEFGAHGVLVLGHPAYYPRFGFSAQTAAKVSSPYSGSPAFMALALEPGAFEAPLTIAYPDAFAG